MLASCCPPRPARCLLMHDADKLLPTTPCTLPRALPTVPCILALPYRDEPHPVGTHHGAASASLAQGAASSIHVSRITHHVSHITYHISRITQLQTVDAATERVLRSEPNIFVATGPTVRNPTLPSSPPPCIHPFHATHPLPDLCPVLNPIQKINCVCVCHSYERISSSTCPVPQPLTLDCLTPQKQGLHPRSVWEGELVW